MKLFGGVSSSVGDTDADADVVADADAGEDFGILIGLSNCCDGDGAAIFLGVVIGDISLTALLPPKYLSTCAERSEAHFHEE